MDNRRLFALKIFQGLRYDETIQVRCIWGIDYPDGDLEAMKGLDYPDGDIKSISCGNLTKARQRLHGPQLPAQVPGPNAGDATIANWERHVLACHPCILYPLC